VLASAGGSKAAEERKVATARQEKAPK